MARNSEARDAVRSFMPVPHLVRTGDFDALSYKFQARNQLSGESFFTDRQLALFSLDAYRSKQDEGNVKDVLDIVFDGVSLEVGSETPVTGWDKARGVVLSAGSADAMLLHVEYVNGPQHVRRELGRVARHIAGNQELHDTPLVLGATCYEMAKLGETLGMRPFQIYGIDSSLAGDIEASYALSFPKRHAEGWFEHAAVYLPTDEFIDRFGHN